MNAKVVILCAAISTLGACGNDASNAGPALDAPPASTGCPAGDAVAIDLVADDGVGLIADLYPSASPEDGKAVILLHMIPPSNSKANYPVAFAETLQTAGFTVLNVNRRGAPGSGGTASDAYTGPSGKLDAKAAYDYLVGECKIGSYSLIGASNGTTTVVDFAVFAATTDGIDAPQEIVGLSGGPYSENQNVIADNLANLPARALLAYPAAEAGWNEGIKTLSPNWSFIEYAPGAHGTGLISSNPEITDSLLEFLAIP